MLRSFAITELSYTEISDLESVSDRIDYDGYLNEAREPDYYELHSFGHWLCY